MHSSCDITANLRPSFGSNIREYKLQRLVKPFIQKTSLSTFKYNILVLSHKLSGLHSHYKLCKLFVSSLIVSITSLSTCATAANQCPKKSGNYQIF